MRPPQTRGGCQRAARSLAPTTLVAAPQLRRAKRCVADSCCASVVLQFHEKDMSRAFADVFTAVHLGVKPAHLTRRDVNVTRIAGLSNQTALKRRKRVHDAIGMLVRLGPLPRFVAILQNPHPLVLEDDLFYLDQCSSGQPPASPFLSNGTSTSLTGQSASARRSLRSPSAEEIDQPAAFVAEFVERCGQPPLARRRQRD